MRWPRSRAARNSRGGVLEVLVEHDREYGVRARIAVELGEPPEAPPGRARARRRLADRAHDGVAREIELLQAPELDEARVDRIELRQQQAVQGLAEAPLGARDEIAARPRRRPSSPSLPSSARARRPGSPAVRPV